MCAHKAIKTRHSPEAGAIGGCELPDVGDGPSSSPL